MSTARGLLRVFVYGTLKRGERNHDRYCTGVVAIEPACVVGRLYHLPQGYPMLQVPAASVLALGTADVLADVQRQNDLWQPERCRPPDETWHQIAGELLQFDDPLSRLPSLDGLEGVEPGRPSPYWRTLLPLIEPAGVMAWAYIAPDGQLPAGARPWGTVWP